MRRRTFSYAACCFAIALCFVVLVNWWQQYRSSKLQPEAEASRVLLLESTAFSLMIKTSGYVVGWSVCNCWSSEAHFASLLCIQGLE